MFIVKDGRLELDKETMFYFYSTHGLPQELYLDLAKKRLKELLIKHGKDTNSV